MPGSGEYKQGPFDVEQSGIFYVAHVAPILAKANDPYDNSFRVRPWNPVSSLSCPVE